MHYLTYVFIPEHTDVASAVVQALRPFGCEFEVAPWKKYLGEEEIAAMAKHYAVSRVDLQMLAGCVEDWNGGEGGLDERGLFVIHAYNPDAKWDRYEIGGRWDGKLRDNMRTARSLARRKKLAALLPHDFLTPDGKWHEIATFVPSGLAGHIVHKPMGRWQREFVRALRRWPDHRLVVVDRHC